MLKARIITALILIPLVIWPTIFLNKFWFGVILLPVILASTWEWNQLFNYRYQIFSIVLSIVGFIFYMCFIVTEPFIYETQTLNYGLSKNIFDGDSFYWLFGVMKQSIAGVFFIFWFFIVPLIISNYQKKSHSQSLILEAPLMNFLILTFGYFCLLYTSPSPRD